MKKVILKDDSKNEVEFELETLAKHINLFHKTGTRLEWEIQRLGCHDRWAESCNA